MFLILVATSALSLLIETSDTDEDTHCGGEREREFAEEMVDGTLQGHRITEVIDVVDRDSRFSNAWETSEKRFPRATKIFRYALQKFNI